jgi:hypothetical protein
MSTVVWIIVTVVALFVAWYALQGVLAFTIPKRITGTLLLKQELRKNGIQPDVLPAQFFSDCVRWADSVSMMAGDLPMRGSPVAKRAEFVRAIENLARMAVLWRDDPDSKMFKSWGQSKNGYRELFEKYDFGARSLSSAPVHESQPDARRAIREPMVSASRYYEIDGQPAIVVDGANFGALRSQNGSWAAEQPAMIESKGRAITADEFAALRARDRDWGGHLTDNLNLNVLLEARGLIRPPP